MGCRNRAVACLTAALASLALVTTGCGTAKAGEEGAGPPGDPLRVLLAGDSITAGYYASGEDRSYAALLEDEWDDTAPVDAQSIGQPGARAWRIARAVAELDPAALDVAVLEVGANDVGKSTVAEYSESVDRLADNAETGSPGLLTVCLGPWNDPVASAAYDEAVAQVCDGGGRVYVQVSDLFVEEGMRGPAGVETPYGERDAFHPNDRAHAEIARRIADVVHEAGLT